MLSLLWEESVDAAFNLVEPGPTSGAFILAICRFTRAGPAADRAVALVLEGVIRNLVFANVFPNGIAVPICHRVQFHDLAAGGFIEKVDFNNADVAARSGLFATQ